MRLSLIPGTDFELGAGLALLLSLVSLTAATLKTVNFRDFKELVQSVPKVGTRQTAVLVIAFEYGLALALLLAPKVGLALFLLFIVGATWFLWFALSRNLGCGCFGSPTQKVTAASFARNAALFLVAALAVATAPTTASYGHVLAACAVLILGGALVGSATVIRGWLV